MSTPLLGSSPPVIPIPRQPSPLAFSVSSHSHAHSPPPSPDGRSNRPSIGGSSVSSVALALPPGVEILNSDQLPPTRTKPYIPKSGEDLVPVQPLQDSLLFRSTIAQLDSSCGTLRKFSKAVHHASTALELALEAVEKAEDDLLYAIGEMSRWLELGYGIPTLDVWGDMGVRKARRKKWRVERDEVHAMVSQGCANVKSEMKRHGLAGGGAQAKFEKVTKQYYDQTGAYLSTSDSSSSKHSAPTRSSTVDSEQATRTAQFDLARYTHHSTLLYAVPPSSISCLDMLVNLYGWTGGILSEQGGYGYTDSQISSISHSDSDRRSSLSVLDMRESLSVSLARLAGIRGELLDRWDMRNDQTNRLDVLTGRASVDVPSSARDRDQAQSPSSLIQTTPISSSGIEHRDSREHRKHRIHKIQKSVGGRLRDLLGSGSSSKDLASLERGHGSAYGLSSGLGGERSNRNSFDVSVLARPGAIGRAGGGQAIQEEVDGGGAEGTKSSPLPSIEPQSMPTRPVFPSRRSMNLSPTEAPFIVDSSLFPLAPAMSQEPRSSISSQASSTEPVGKVEKDVGAGLGSGLPGRGAVQARQAMEELDDVGRKKEGVLWGGGTWEDVGKQGKTKWEKYWVVLDHSSIYEYRDADFERPETAHAMIDLKFASIREGRGTDRRFVFEIVTPTQGRRLYQATSEVEMKQWIHAITNAIESSINGTSSIRTFDTSKIRTLSGSYDDHALPIRQRLGFPVPGIRPSGSTSGSAGLSLPTIPASPSGRRSMPPPIRIEDGPGITTSEPKRKRQTSFKKAFRQSAEIASQWKDGLVPRSPSFISDPSRPPFLGIAKRQNSASSGVSSGGVSYASHVAAVGREEDPEVLKRITEDTLVTSTMGPVAGDRSFGSWVEVDDAHSSVGGGHDGEIEKRVMEMAGLGLGNSPGRIPSDRRVKSDGRGKEDGTHLSPPFREMTRSRSADVPVRSDMVGEAERGGEVLDMDTLRRAAAKEGNAVCADCRRSTRSSRWASICLREQPMVIFLCIKCCGIHRSFGTHISKPRSVDLDIWTPETIALALQWGNERANEMWEYAGADAYRPLADEDMTAFCKAKYVEGRFLSDVDRRRFGLI